MNSKITEIASMQNICKKRDTKRKRMSSYDKTGGNDDRTYIPAGSAYTIAEIDECGVINHIWMTLMNEGFQPEKNSLRKIILEFFWDDEKTPSVRVPIGDFFGMGHAMSKNFVSAPLQMSPEDGKGFNSWWPMPFRKRAKLNVVNECNTTLILYYYIDYETADALSDDMLYFHAQWNRDCPTKGHDEATFRDHNAWCFEGDNKDNSENYVVLEAEGKGHYCGCNVNIHNLSTSALWDWPGEGDDVIFIDDDEDLTLYGTGTEDYVCQAWCPTQEYSAPYHGLILGGKDNWKGKITYYRYHINDPVTFDKKIKATIEHGHNNNRSDDWSTTAYWYQTEPHKPFKPMLSVDKRMPVDEECLSRSAQVVFEDHKK